MASRWNVYRTPGKLSLSLRAGSGLRHREDTKYTLMKLKTALLTAVTVLSALSPFALGAMPPAEAWEIGPDIRGRNYSVGMPAQPTATREGGLSFEFPQRGEIDALTTSVGPLTGAREITLQYRIDAAPGARFVSAETPDQTATISLYIQQDGDNWTAKGRYASYRWYVPARAVVPLSPGTHKVRVRLDEVWTNVRGLPNTADPQGYTSALNETGRIGIAFGTSSARSHGVYTTGPARFTLLGLDIN